MLRLITEFIDFERYLANRIMRKVPEPLYISSYGFRPSTVIKNAINYSSRPILIYANHDSFVEPLRPRDNVSFYNCPEHHSKLIIDGDECYVGSQNIGYADTWFNSGVLFRNPEIAAALKKRLAGLKRRPTPNYDKWLSKLNSNEQSKTKRKLQQKPKRKKSTTPRAKDSRSKNP